MRIKRMNEAKQCKGAPREWIVNIDVVKLKVTLRVESLQNSNYYSYEINVGMKT